MKVLITDDEPPARSRLNNMLAERDGVNVVGEAANGLEAVEKVQKTRPDVVLMDIRMPGMDGLEAARYLSQMEEPPAIIFTTAYSEHALEAFDAHAVAYLVKPIRREHLNAALEKTRKLTKAQLSTLSRETEQTGRTHICARIRGNLELFPVENVIYFQADQKYVTVRHIHGEVLIEDALKNLEQEFAPKLVRIHRNALVNTAYVAGMDKEGPSRFLVKFNKIDDRLEISRRHVAEVRRLLRG